MRKRGVMFALALSLLVAAGVGITAATEFQFTPRDKAYYMDANLVNFVRPGVVVKIKSAQIASDGTISARLTVTDPKGLPLDRLGVNTPGVVSLSLIAVYIPAGKRQYVSYTTTTLAATINKNPSQVQAANDSGGTWTTNVEGDYTYTFKTKTPAGFDAAATHAIGVSARRPLTEFGLEQVEWAQVSNDVFTFVPNGSPVKVTRAVVPTSACNQCHDVMYGHGGSRITVELCITCHTPQTINPDTLHSQDMPVLIHKIHMGKDLPSVKAGTPYRIWHRGAWSDFSEVGLPTEPNNCQICHQGNLPNADAWLKNPNRAACGACHDDVDFATGKNHANLPQVSDNMCVNCHMPQGEVEFDTSIKGAHQIPQKSAALFQNNATITKVDGAAAGKPITVTFTVKDRSGNVVDVTKLDSLSLLIAGPTTDYTWQISESAKTATASGGNYIYTFTKPLPTTAKGSYAVSIEGYKAYTLNPGMTNAIAGIRDAVTNPILYFSVDGSKVAPRRQVVDQAKCNTCHGTLMPHGTFRRTVQYCTFCHNPTADDVPYRPKDQLPTESINFKTMVHKIHTGKELQTDFTVIGYRGTVMNYNEVTYPGDRRNCEQCHLPGTYGLPLPAGVIAQTAPRDYLNPLQPAAGACLSCHTTKAAAAHAAIMTSPTLGESCEACHSTTSEASVAKAHAR